MLSEIIGLLINIRNLMCTLHPAGSFMSEPRTMKQVVGVSHTHAHDKTRTGTRASL